MNESGSQQNTTTIQLGRYRLLRQVGRGGMGDVWLGEDPRLHRQVAVKLLPSHNQQDQEYAMRFEREARAAAALNHPHILPIHDYGKQTLPDGQTITYIVMPYIPGGSLTDRIATYTQQNALMPSSESLAYLSQAADAIDYAHKHGIVHRDIKPANMLLRSDNWLLLADFGIARILSSTENLTQAGVGFGTPEYMAPEQAQGKAEAASDRYSLAVIAYYLLTGRLPFKAETAHATTIQHIMLPPPPPRQINPALSAACEMVLLHGLAKQPAERPATARALVDELQRSWSDTPPVAMPSEATYVRPRPFEPQPAQHVPGSIAPVSTSAYSAASQATYVSNSFANNVPTPQQANGLSRRRLLIGGGTALVVLGGGLGTWAWATRASNSQNTITHKDSLSPAFTSDPNAPDLLLQGHTKPVTALAWSPLATNTLASAAEDGEVHLWNIQQSQATSKTSVLTTTTKHAFKSSGTMLLAWSSDGSALAIGSSNQVKQNATASIALYTSTLQHTAPGYDTPIILPGSPAIVGLGWQGSYLVAATILPSQIGQKEFQLALWNTRQPQQQLDTTLVAGDLSTSMAGKQSLLVVSPDGSSIAFAGNDGVVIGQASVTGTTTQWKQRIGPLKFAPNTASANRAEAVVWSPAGDIIGSFNTQTGNGSAILLWGLPDAVDQYRLPTNILLTTLAWCPTSTSKLIAAGSKDGRVLIWHIGKSQIPVTLKGTSQAEVATLAWSHDGQWLAAGYNDPNASISIWKIQGRGF